MVYATKWDIESDCGDVRLRVRHDLTPEEAETLAGQLYDYAEAARKWRATQAARAGLHLEVRQ